MAASVAAARLRCSYSAEERGDPLPGTAAHAMGFLLIEAPGAWGQNALSESRLDPDIANLVAARAAELSYRVLLIKRPGRAAVEPRRAWAVVSSTPGAESTTWGSYVSDGELLDIPLAPVAAPRATPSTLYLVCTHGRHDACCALRGRPVAARLAAVRPGQVWECSHIGGDRFAPNVLVLPHGLYYGRVEPGRALDLVAAQERSEVLVDLLRGRSVYRPPVQAAQHFARLAHGGALIDDLEPVGRHTAASGDVNVDLTHGNTRMTVTIRPIVGDEAGLLTCKATYPLHPPTFSLEGIELHD
jgi:hypothetical protein